jgi:hypothetical protein
MVRHSFIQLAATHRPVITQLRRSRWKRHLCLEQSFRDITSINLSVKLYCTTDAVSSTTVSDGQYTTRDSISISAGCSVDHGLQHANDVGWTAVPTKHKYIEGRT